jgi:hypothetical protein
MDLFKKYLLASVAAFAPPDLPNEGGDDGQEDATLSQGEEVGAVPGSDEGEEAQDDEGLEAADDSEGNDEGQVEEPARKPSRAQSRIQSLTQTARETKERADRLERELSDFRAEQRAKEQRSQQESPEAKAARRALMDPMDIMREDVRDAEQRTQHLLQQQAMQIQETQDKLLYNSILRDAPHLKKYDADVEKVRLEQQARGVFVPREVLLDLAIGRAARAAAVKSAPKAQKEGARKVAQAQSRPAQARGDTATQRGKQGDSAEKRLENVPI